MKRILVTGAAGFTGRYIGSVLAERGYEVHGLVNGADKPAAGYSHFHQADLTDAMEVARVVPEVGAAHIVHLAAIAFVAHDDIDRMYRVNLLGTRNLLDVLHRCETKPRSVLLASSANVYGNARSGMLDEETPLSPANDYGVSKAAMEFVASIYRPSLPVIVARPFNYTGVGQEAQFIIPKIVEHARSRADVLELGNLDVARDFSDVRTVVDAYARLLFADAAIGQTFNVCSGRAVALKQVLDVVGKLSGRAFDVRVNPAFVRSNEVRSLHGSKAKIERAIGPLRHIPLEETLSWMLND